MKNFVIVPKQVIRMHLSGSEFLLYVTIRGFCYGYKKTCWPSVETITKESGLSKSSILRASKVLEAKGLIKVIERFKPNGLNDSNLYVLLPLEDEIEADQPEVTEETEVEEPTLEEPQTEETEVNETEESNKKCPSKESESKEEQAHKSHTTSISGKDTTKESNTCQAKINLDFVCSTLNLSTSEIELVKGLLSFSSLTCSHVILGGKGYSVSEIKVKLESVTSDQMRRALNKLEKYQVSNKSAYLISILLSQPEASSTSTNKAQKAHKAKKPNKFNNFHQREYNFEELEAKLANL